MVLNHGQQTPGLTCGPDHRLDLPGRYRQRLFAKNVLASGQAVQHDRCVSGVRRADVDRVNLFELQQLAVIVEDVRDIVLGGRHLRSLGSDVRDGHNLHVLDRLPGWNMYPPSDPTRADSDGDGLGDLAEILAGTDPLLMDSDGDAIPDGWDSAPLYTDLNGCSGSDPVLSGYTWYDGETFSCRATGSITLRSPSLAQPGSTLGLTAPVVRLEAGTRVQAGSRLWIPGATPH